MIRDTIFKEVLLEPKPKCEYGECEHGPKDHEAGVCWHIVNDKLIDVPDEKKFCGCKSTPELIHGWDILKIRNPINGEGWQDPGKKVTIIRDPLTKQIIKKIVEYENICITKKCNTCGKIALLGVEEDSCHGCPGLEKGLLR